MQSKTEQQYQIAFKGCRDIFFKKTKDYGTAWRILRPSSLTDQIFIKASRIRNIEEVGHSKIAEGVIPEYMGIVNYSILATIQLEMGAKENLELSIEEAMRLYDEKVAASTALMLAKNHDYGEAWRSMRVTSFTDLILMKLLRVKQIEDNQGKTLVSEGMDANFFDMINYAIFALIKLEG